MSLTKEQIEAMRTRFYAGYAVRTDFDVLCDIAIQSLSASRPEPVGEPFVWYKVALQITDEYETVYSDDETRPKGEGWEALYTAAQLQQAVLKEREEQKGARQLAIAKVLEESADRGHTPTDMRSVARMFRTAAECRTAPPDSPAGGVEGDAP